MHDSRRSDTAIIRKGEELNETTLKSYLTAHLPAIMVDENFDEAKLQIEQFPGGHSNLTYQIRFGPREMVLRRPPVGPVAPTAHDMPREYRLLAAIHPVFPLAPQPYLLCEDLNVIGAPFYLMERRRGLVIRRSLPEQIGNSLTTRRAISEAMIDTLAALHRIDVAASRLMSLGKPVGFVTRQVRGWADRWHRAKLHDVAKIDAVIEWMMERLPPEPDSAAGCPPRLVHNDFKLDNVMLDESDPTKIVAVLDWEMCTIGDPLIDLGILLCYWPERDDPEARRESISAVTTEAGWLTRKELVERYEQVTGRDVSLIAFYEVFALFKIAVVVQQIYVRYVRGQTQDARFADFGARVEGLIEAAYDLAQRSGI